MKDTKKPAGRKPPRSGGAKPFNKGGNGPRAKIASKPKAATGAERGQHAAVQGEGERISKIMARAGVASRRDCERMILEGRVRLNGTVLTTPAINCTPSDLIEVDGEPIGAIERTRLWIYYKPAGLVTTNYDPEGRPTVFDNLPPELPRVISVGRLDINTEGLLLLTNDGGLARVLELPSTGWLRRYRVRAYGSIDQAKLDSLKEGIAVDGVFYGAIEATLDREQGHNVWITMGLREGKNREIKNVLGALGLDVNRLIRISYGPFQLGELEEGQVVEIRSRTLRDQLGPRLIEDANANFEAPIANPPKAEEPEARAEEERAPAKRRETREERRDRDLSRIDTKRPDRDGRQDRYPPRDRQDRDGERGGDKKKRPPLGTSRTTNVWMAPGARPQATTRSSEDVVTDRAGRKIVAVRKEETKSDDAASKKKSGRPQGKKPPKGKSTAAPAKGRDDFKRRDDFKGRSGEGRNAERRERSFEGKPSGGPGGDRKPARGDRPGNGPRQGGNGPRPAGNGKGRGADRRR